MNRSRCRNEAQWRRFVDYAGRARAKPSFDVEEREYRLEVAEAVRRVLETARRRAPVLPGLRSILFDQMGQRPYSLIAPGHKRWMVDWASADDGRLARALARLASPEETPAERVAILAAAVEDAIEHPTVAVGILPAVVALGSLFAFAFDPERLPIVRPQLFQQLQDVLGYDSKPTRSPASKYEHDVRFAEAAQLAMSKAGVPIRDMVDAESLIVIAAEDRDFWALERDAQRPARVTAGSVRRSRTPEAYLSVCAIYRDEAPYLAEWLEFHRLVGVEKFFLYNNLSEDEHRDVLSPYIGQGVVDLHDWPLFPGQRQAYDHCIEEHGAQSRWIAFIDLDEFLFSPTGHPVSELMTEYETWPGVAVNRPKFGTSGHRTKPQGLVIENYVMRIETVASNQVKSIVDPLMVVRSASAHHFIYKRYCAVDENGYPVHRLMTKSASFARLRLNHYDSKSEAELREKSATRTADAGAERRPVPDFAELREGETAVSVRDEAILRYVPALREALARAEVARGEARTRRE